MYLLFSGFHWGDTEPGVVSGSKRTKKKHTCIYGLILIYSHLVRVLKRFVIYSNQMPSHHIVHAQDPQDVVEQLQAISPLIMRPVSHTDQRSAQLPQHHG